MEIPPEIEEITQKLKAQHGLIRHMNESFYTKALEEALEFHGCFLSFWNYRGLKTFVIKRNDRLPDPSEFLYFLQTLFDDGEIIEVLKTETSRHFCQGSSLFFTDSMSEKMGQALANYADKKDEVEQFDLDATSTGKRMMRRLRNGHE